MPKPKDWAALAERYSLEESAAIMAPTAAMLAIAYELRTANLLAAAATLGGDTAAVCGELAVDRLGGATRAEHQYACDTEHDTGPCRA